MADAIILAIWAAFWGAFALWAWRTGYRRGAGRRCRGVQLWTSTAERGAE